MFLLKIDLNLPSVYCNRFREIDASVLALYLLEPSNKQNYDLMICDM